MTNFKLPSFLWSQPHDTFEETQRQPAGLELVDAPSQKYGIITVREILLGEERMNGSKNAANCL